MSKTKRAYVWVYRTTNFVAQRAVLFDFCTSRGGVHTQRMLQGFSGTLQAHSCLEIQATVLALASLDKVVNGFDIGKTIQFWANSPRIVFLPMNNSDSYRAAAQELCVFGFISKSDFVNELPRILEKSGGLTEKR